MNTVEKLQKNNESDRSLQAIDEEKYVSSKKFFDILRKEVNSRYEDI